MKTLLFTVFSVFLINQAQAGEICRLAAAPTYSVRLETINTKINLVLFAGNRVIAHGIARQKPTHVGTEIFAVAEESGQKMIYSAAGFGENTFSYVGFLAGACIPLGE